MPALDPDDRTALLGPQGTCAICTFWRVRHYCRSCDAFFVTCGCQVEREAMLDAHARHRIYLWTPYRILALPDFDQLTRRLH